MKHLTDFWDWVDNRAVIRRIMLFITLWMTWRAYTWAAEFAMFTDKDGVQVGLIIAAVTAPITALQGFVFKIYSDARSGQ